MGYDGKFIGYKVSDEEKMADIKRRFNPGFTVLKESMKGSTYRAAVRNEENGQVFAVVAFTHMRDGWFMVKLMDETYGPGYFDYPKTYLDMLTPIDNDFANEWREKVREHSSKKSVPMDKRRFTNGCAEMTLGEIEEVYHTCRGYLARSNIVRRQKVGGSFILGGTEYTRTF